MTHKQTPTATHKKDRSMKSAFIFLENDDGKETTVYHCCCWYDYRIISELDSADILHQNSRYRTNRYRKQSCISARTDVNIADYGDHRNLFHRMMEDGVIWYGKPRTQSDEKNISTMLRVYPQTFLQVFHQQLFWCTRKKDK